MVRTHKAIFDADLSGDQVDQPPVDEMRADPPRSLFCQNKRLAFNSGQTTDAGPDRTSGPHLEIVAHLSQAGILERLAGGIRQRRALELDQRAGYRAALERQRDAPPRRCPCRMSNETYTVG